jgi:cell division protein FtsZ
MVFITTGMGGGTGTGAAPIIAEVAKEMGILTVAVVTRPFPFEGRKRMQIADEGIRALSESVDSLITIPNEKLLTILGKDASLLSAFAKADDVLAGAVRGISDIIKRPGMINVDFADVRTVMSEMGMAMMGTGCASGPNRAREATEAAIRNPLLEDVNLEGARGILVNITAGPDLSLGEYSDVGSIIEAFASEHAMVKVGTVIDPDMRDELHVTVVATGLGAKIEKPVKVIDNTVQTSMSAQSQAPAPARQELPSVNYRDLDRPTVMRNQAQSNAATAAKLNPQDDLDYLDIPAFLRRQAD